MQYSIKTAGLVRQLRLHKKGESFFSTQPQKEAAGRGSVLNIKVKTQKAILLFPNEQNQPTIPITVVTILDKSNVQGAGRAGRPSFSRQKVKEQLKSQIKSQLFEKVKKFLEVKDSGKKD